MSNGEGVSAILKRLHRASPSGFAIGLHITYTTPRYMFQSYPREWLDTYSRQGLLMRDPTVNWGFANRGWMRWSALADDDPDGVMRMAAEHGINFGVVISTLRGGSRTIASFARPDREFTDDEIAAIEEDLGRLHDATLKAPFLSPSLHEMLRQMSIYLTHG